VWIYGLTNGSARRFTDDRGEVYWAIWSPDGRVIAFNSSMASPVGNDLYVKLADGTSVERRLTTNQLHLPPRAWADGGKTLMAVRGIHPDPGFDIVRVSAEAGGTPQPFLNARFNEWDAVMSPNGRWLAHASDESRRAEVYVRPYPGPGEAVQVTTEGGREPTWDPAGKALYYRDDTGGKAYKVSIQTEPVIQVGTPALLFEGKFEIGIYWGRNYDLSPSGDFFVMIAEEEPLPATQINVVLNWPEELQRFGAARS
jgi:Tol biopolymer transport system component